MRSLTAWLLAIHCMTATAKQFYLQKTYDANNFFDSFDFRTSGSNTSQYDDNNSWVRYQNLTKARSKGLAQIKDDEVYLGVDYTNVLDASPEGGRDTLRVISKDTFKYRLIITRFTYMPKRICGAWPAYWTLSVGKWPNTSEIDIYEGWNLNVFNKPGIHVGPKAEFGVCKIRQHNQSAIIVSKDCDNEFENGINALKGQGCQSEEKENSIYSSAEGGIQALEWTQDSINLFTWPYSKEPNNLDQEDLNTSLWGKPSVQIHGSQCDINGIFQDQQLLFTLPFCGIPPGHKYFWTKLDGRSGQTCDKATNYLTCIDFVAKNPEAFKDFYF
ncbi:hypothetical protein H634G_09805 [Metarhizium anisopliae BRIP 53293]|uniref:GH16 domain-containing protein n=1 Tax=Metarhizium anisopliae BRIP 53293 TaxID=1291518 RepID=A0A0D9NM36_METAN|nr:hypothetical protein H634G_09805 [Metarhizium anisopliae BRIP 53293]